jgi:hypothetical protein
MKFSLVTTLALGLASLGTAHARRTGAHVGKKFPELKRNVAPRTAAPDAAPQLGKRAEHQFLTNATKSTFFITWNCKAARVWLIPID